MATERKSRSLLVDQLAQFMAKEIEEISDQDLLEEIGGGSAQGLARAEHFRDLLKERVTKARQARLLAARAGYASALSRRTNAPRKQPPIDAVREQIKTLFAKASDVPLAVAWRNGEYQSDKDLLTLYDQLCELGAIKEF